MADSIRAWYHQYGTFRLWILNSSWATIKVVTELLSWGGGSFKNNIISKHQRHLIGKLLAFHRIFEHHYFELSLLIRSMGSTTCVIFCPIFFVHFWENFTIFRFVASTINSLLVQKKLFHPDFILFSRLADRQGVFQERFFQGLARFFVLFAWIINNTGLVIFLINCTSAVRR